MNGQEFPVVDVAVAIVMNSKQQILWTWNATWGAFALPMTKRRTADGLVEDPRQAAARAAAEVLGVPVQVGPHWSPMPELKVSGRDHAVKRYAYDVYRVDPHPHFAAVWDRPGLLWLSVEQAFTWQYQPPLSHASLDVVSQLILANKIEGHTQLDSTVIFQRQHGDARQFLLRWNQNWGYALPSKRRKEHEPPLDAVWRIIEAELGLNPDLDTTIAVAAIPAFTTHDVSDRTGLPTFYVHALFDGTLLSKPPVSPDPDLPLVWASEQEIQEGKMAPPHQPARPGKAEAGKISRTVFRILSALDYVRWTDLI